MTESELCGSSFDWEGGSPSVFFRPMNPALSAQHYSPEDSPVVLEEKDSLRRHGMYMTPASPLFGSISYMSQESSCCSALNTAVIMEDDDNETIPTDERPSLIPAGVPEDVSPIVEKSFNVSDLPVANVTTTTNTSIPLASQSVEDRSNSSSLQELLYNAPPAVDVGFVGSSPGPQWSPGIRSGAPMVKSPNPPLIRIENFLDASPSISPKKFGPIDSSLSISAIMPTAPESPEEEAPVTTNHKDLEARKRAFMEPSPVRRFTHQRSTLNDPVPISIPRLPIKSVERSLPIRREFRENISPRFDPPPRLYEPRQAVSARKTVLSSEERQLKEAEDGRRRLLNRIRQNRRSLESSRLDDSRRHIFLQDSDRRSFIGNSPSMIRSFSRPSSPGPLQAVDRLKSRLDTSRSFMRSSSLDRSSLPSRPVLERSIMGERASMPARTVKVELYSQPVSRGLGIGLYGAHRRQTTTTSTLTSRPAWR